MGTRSIIADHDFVTCNYHVKDISRKPQTKTRRDFRNVTKENLQILIEESTLLNTIFQTMDPNKAMNILATEFNKFINFLAPEKRITIKRMKSPILQMK